MAQVSFKEVRNKCIEGRFFAYEGIHDKIFSKISIFLVWFFVRLGWSGNAVSVLSGIIAIAGGTLMASTNTKLVILGSFGYMLFFLLDYVDGGVARFSGQSGIGGQYIDWSMHVVTALGYGAGFLAASVTLVGFWIVPFGVLTIVAMALALDRYALGWFAICMYYQQQKAKGTKGKLPVIVISSKESLFSKLCRNFTTLLFHENYLIFLFPILSIIQYLNPFSYFDFRVIFLIFGGLIYFPYILYDMLKMANQGKIDNAYNKLFFEEGIPKLPEEHFLG
jgi:hypothetical protein